MGLTEADGGVVIGVREARRVLTSSSRTSAGVGSRGSMEVSVTGPVFCHGTRMRHKVRVQTDGFIGNSESKETEVRRVRDDKESSGFLALGNSWYFLGRYPGKNRDRGDEGASRGK